MLQIKQYLQLTAGTDGIDMFGADLLQNDPPLQTFMDTGINYTAAACGIEDLDILIVRVLSMTLNSGMGIGIITAFSSSE